MEISDWPDKELGIMLIKNTHHGQNNTWTKWEFQQRDRKQKKVPNKMTDQKNTKMKLRNSIEVLSNRQDEMEQRIHELKDRTVEFIQSEERKEKNNVKEWRFGTYGIPLSGPIFTFKGGPRRRREKEARNFFEEIIAENFSNLYYRRKRHPNPGRQKVLHEDTL